MRKSDTRGVPEGSDHVTTSSSPDVAVVIVTWNGLTYLPACLDSILDQTMQRSRYEVLVVDNASSDGTLEFLTEHYPDVRVIRSDSNRGFAGGCSLGLASTTAAVAVLLNNDATAEPDFLEQIVEPLRESNIAAVTAKVLLMPRFRDAKPGELATISAGGRSLVVASSDDNPRDLVDVVNSTGNEVDQHGYGRDRGWLAVDGLPYPSDVFGFCGAAAALDTSAVHAVGGFDDDYFLYYEDTDLSWRLRLAGYRIVYAPSAVVRHHHASSSGEGSRLHRFYDDRNRLLTLTKNAPASLALAGALRFPFTTLSIARTDLPRLPWTRTRLRAAASYLQLLPRILTRRRAVARIATVNRKAVVANISRQPATSTARYRF